MSDITFKCKIFNEQVISNQHDKIDFGNND